MALRGTEGSTDRSANESAAQNEGREADRLAPLRAPDELQSTGEPTDVAILSTKSRDPESVDRLFALLRHASGIDFGSYARTVVERRVGRRMRLCAMDTLGAYVRHLQSCEHELSALRRDLLVGVTSFFRDQPAFASTQPIAFRRIVENRDPDRPVRMWVAGCSTGEEAYSLVIEFLEYADRYAEVPAIQVFATDVDEQALARARKGVYPASIAEVVSPERLERFFIRHGDEYQISPAVRDLIIFARHNLIEDPPYSRLDLISCRNVLIYLQPCLQRQVLSLFHFALCPERFLILGASEPIGDCDLFSLVDRSTRIYTSRGNPTFTALGRPRAHATFRAEIPRPLRPSQPMSVGAMADCEVLARYGPPGLVIDDRLQILQYRGRLSRFIDPRPGMATLNVLKQLRPELTTAIYALLEETHATGRPVRSRAVRLDESEIVIDVIPLRDSSARLIVFNEAAAHGAPHAAISVVDPEPEAMKRELDATKDCLQTIIEELQSANEELKSFNEDLQSSNEELRSSNEQLDAARDAMQEMNEELATLNEELNRQMMDRSASCEELDAILEVLGRPVVLVDR